MNFYKKYLLAFLVSMPLLSCNDSNSDKLPPQITAQGFTIDELQEGNAGGFGALKLRIESAGRVKQLNIKERSYEVDLATTPERSHFALFGIEKKALLRTDVTLDFQNYINQKLKQPGQYKFDVEVIDKKGQSARVTLNVRVLKSKGTKTPIETGRFQMQRRGGGAVIGAEPFGVTWKTIDEVKVTVSVFRAAGSTSKLARFSIADYEQLASKEDLTKKIDAAKDMEKIEFDTASNAAENQVLGVSRSGKYYMLKTEHSNTALSYIGTTVTLNGEYKF